MRTQDAALNWRTSSYSDAHGECVEVAADQGMVAVRDSKHREQGSYRFSQAAWAGLVNRIQAGGLDFPSA